MSSNLERPPERRFIKKPKNKKAGINPHQKRFSLVASNMPLPANTNSSSHFLQFIWKLYHNKPYVCQVIFVRFLVITSVKIDRSGNKLKHK